jgi:hypothetical protein
MTAKPKTYYVTMTDKFMSGWGQANNQIAKYVYVCDTYEQAEIVAANAERRGDQKYVNITDRKPSYNSRRYHVEFKTIENSAIWYKPGAFNHF